MFLLVIIIDYAQSVRVKELLEITTRSKIEANTSWSLEIIIKYIHNDREISLRNFKCIHYLRDISWWCRDVGVNDDLSLQLLKTNVSLTIASLSAFYFMLIDISMRPFL